LFPCNKIYSRKLSICEEENGAKWRRKISKCFFTIYNKYFDILNLIHPVYLLLLTKQMMHLFYSFLFLQSAIGHVSCSTINTCTCIYILFLLKYKLCIWKDSLLSNCSLELNGITNICWYLFFCTLDAVRTGHSAALENEIEENKQ